MIIELVINDEKKKADLTRPIDLSLTSKVKNSFKAWYVDEIQINVIKNGDFVGSVKQGGSVNFKELLINPHGNMTHTESVGHISNQEVFVNNILSQYHFAAQLITIRPQEASYDMESGIKVGDFFIGIEQIKDKIKPNSSILLVDDILTTGATLTTCAKILSHYKPKKIDIAVVAVTELD